jgi:NAD(P)H-hydrate epimerase
VAGASASGCGSLRAALPIEVSKGLWQQAPHVLLEPPLEAGADGSSNLAALAAPQPDRLDAVLLGPGLGLATAAADPGSAPAADDEALWAQLQIFPGLLLLDADGLNRLAAREGHPWLKERGGPTWITPHRHEFQRLFNELGDRPPLEAAAAAAERCQVAVLLKGARTVVAGPDGQRWQLGAADGRAARTGLGDVLAGYAAGCGARALAALRSQGAPCSASLAPLLAAAALEHACAGLAASRHWGNGTTPMAVADQLANAGIKTQHNQEML